MTRYVSSSLGRVFLAIALLAGWQAALEHPVRHVDELGEFVHLHDGHSHDDGDSEGSQGGTLCDALAALTACAADAPQPLIASRQCEYSVASWNEAAPRVADAPPFLSQGPPACA